MKKSLIISSIFLIIFIVWVLYSYTRPAILTGKSDDGNWSAEYVPNSVPDKKDTWNGKVKWQGEETISSVTLLEFSSNGNALTSNDEEKDDVNPGDYLEFVAIGERPNNGDYSLRIQWNVDGESMEEIIKFQEKKRFFILPFQLIKGDS